MGEPGLAPDHQCSRWVYNSKWSGGHIDITRRQPGGYSLGNTSLLTPPLTVPHPPPSLPFSAISRRPSSFNSWGTMQTDLSIGGNPITLNSTRYANGLGVHAYSELHYYMAGKCSTLTAITGADDETPPGPPGCIFRYGPMDGRSTQGPF